MPDSNGEKPEVPHDAALHRVRFALSPSVGEIVDILHASGIMTEGEQWTIPFGMSCGFEGQIIIRVHAEGDCDAQKKVR